MGLLSSIVIIIAHILFIGIDVLTFFILARLLWLRWRPSWLTRINSTGKPIVNGFFPYIEKGLSRLSNRPFSETTMLLIGLLSLTFARFFLTALVS